MTSYRKILLALELNPESDQALINKAQELAAEGGELHFIHAVEHLSSYGAAYGVSAGVDVEHMLLEQAQQTMKDVAAQLNLPEAQQIVKLGPSKVLILDEAKALSADLIVVGSHGRHGVRLLLGSTANAVLHGADCDVLAVRLQD